MSPTLPNIVAKRRTDCPSGQHWNLTRALSAVFERLAKKAQLHMRSTPDSMPQPQSQQSMAHAGMMPAVAFAPVRPYARGLWNSKGDFYLKMGAEDAL